MFADGHILYFLSQNGFLFFCAIPLFGTFLSGPLNWARFPLLSNSSPLLSPFLSSPLNWALFWAKLLNWALFWANPLVWALFWALKRVNLLSRALFWVVLLFWALFWALKKALKLSQNLHVPLTKNRYHQWCFYPDCDMGQHSERDKSLWNSLLVCNEFGRPLTVILEPCDWLYLKQPKGSFSHPRATSCLPTMTRRVVSPKLPEGFFLSPEAPKCSAPMTSEH